MMTSAWRCSAMIESHLRRIDEANPCLNAVAVPIAESALEKARKADNAATGEPLVWSSFNREREFSLSGFGDNAGDALMVDAMPAGDAVMIEQYVGLICPVDPVR